MTASGHENSILTVDAAGAVTIDGVAITVGKAVLFVGQTDTSQNVVAVCSIAGAGGVNAVFVRLDMSYEKGAQIVRSSGGTLYKGARFIVSTPPAAIGTDPVAWVQEEPDVLFTTEGYYDQIQSEALDESDTGMLGAALTTSEEQRSALTATGLVVGKKYVAHCSMEIRMTGGRQISGGGADGHIYLGSGLNSFNDSLVALDLSDQTLIGHGSFARADNGNVYGALISTFIEFVATATSQTFSFLGRVGKASPRVFGIRNCKVRVTRYE